MPLFLMALAVLLASLMALSLSLGRARVNAVALAATVVFVGACLVHPPLFGTYGLVAMVLSIPVTAALAIALILQVVAARRQPSVELRWARLGRASWIGQWMALLVLLPGTYAFAWLSSAGVFCF